VCSHLFTPRFSPLVAYPVAAPTSAAAAFRIATDIYYYDCAASSHVGVGRTRMRRRRSVAEER